MNVKAPDSQGWFSIALFILTLVVFGLMAWNPGSLRDNDLFKTLAQATVITGLINLAASFYYGASKAAPPAPKDVAP